MFCTVRLFVQFVHLYFVKSFALLPPVYRSVEPELVTRGTVTELLCTPGSGAEAPLASPAGAGRGTEPSRRSDAADGSRRQASTVTEDRVTDPPFGCRGPTQTEHGHCGFRWFENWLISEF